jgi:hypothetical protein
MSVMEVSDSHNGKLRSLLKSLNDLSALALVQNAEQAWSFNIRLYRVSASPQPCTPGVSINIMVRRVLFTTKEIISEFWVSARPDESLCDILAGQDLYSNWIEIQTAHRNEIPLECMVSSRPYLEIRNKVDSWKNKLFENETKIRRGHTLILRLQDRPEHHAHPLARTRNTN